MMKAKEAEKLAKEMIKHAEKHGIPMKKRKKPKGK